ncbi:MAG: adenosylcobinamide-GDP ribazoletransferase [Candidatus Omnitrophota bacterium]
MHLLRDIYVAARFLTVLPLPEKGAVKPEESARSMAYFPLIGLLIGTVLLCLRAMLSVSASSLLTAAVITGVWVWLTGALHLEGFVDACDGFSAGGEKKKILEVMKDAHCGAKGVIALVLLLILKVILIRDIPRETAPYALLLAPAAGRWAMVYAAFASPYAREAGGFGRGFVENIGVKEVIIASCILACAGIMLLEVKFFIFAIPVFLLTALAVIYLKRRLGGVTGDIMGALNEVIEMVSLTVFLILK